MHKVKLLFSIIKSKNINEIINNIIEIFNDNFIVNIQRLIDTYSENYRNGNLFWSRSKRFPSNIKFNTENPQVIIFIDSYTKLYYNIFSITYNDQEIKNKIIDTINNNDKPKLRENKIDKFINDINYLSKAIR